MRNRVSALIVLPILFGGCSGDTVVAPSFDVAAWESELLDFRDRKDEDFRTSSTSPMAGTQYLKSEVTDRVWLTREAKTFALVYEAPPAAALLLEKPEGAWRWTRQEDGVACGVNGEEVADHAALVDPAVFSVGGSHLSFYPGEERVTFIVFDAERPEMAAFDHLLYFPPDTAYAVDSRVVRLAEPEEVEMLTSRNLVKTFYRYAHLHFRVDGKERKLTAFKSALSGEGSTVLFIPFRDLTSGEETYGSGRFIQLDEPEGEQLLLDFNRGFNPLCNYSPAYNCTVPPRENHLDIAIRAGEKTYPH